MRKLSFRVVVTCPTFKWEYQDVSLSLAVFSSESLLYPSCLLLGLWLLVSIIPCVCRLPQSLLSSTFFLLLCKPTFKTNYLFKSSLISSGFFSILHIDLLWQIKCFIVIIFYDLYRGRVCLFSAENIYIVSQCLTQKKHNNYLAGEIHNWMNKHWIQKNNHSHSQDSTNSAECWHEQTFTFCLLPN